ncbi:MAG: helix-turn-helix domain-containing protein [Isosphaeraceae bacterium]
MSLAQRVRDFRYSKGWGPDELASRAEISRTALYQIESGKTGLPRAGTLRRIAVALDVPMEDLLGNDVDATPAPSFTDRAQPVRPAKTNFGWVPSEGGPMSLPSSSSFSTMSPVSTEESRLPKDVIIKTKSHSYEAPFVREGELMSKLHDLLHSPLGGCITGIVDELHGLLNRSRITT